MLAIWISMQFCPLSKLDHSEPFTSFHQLYNSTVLFFITAWHYVGSKKKHEEGELYAGQYCNCFETCSAIVSMFFQCWYVLPDNLHSFYSTCSDISSVSGNPKSFWLVAICWISVKSFMIAYWRMGERVDLIFLEFIATLQIFLEFKVQFACPGLDRTAWWFEREQSTITLFRLTENVR